MIFNEVAHAKKLLKNGIKPDKYATQNIKYVYKYLQGTEYSYTDRRKLLIKAVRLVYAGMSETYINQALNALVRNITNIELRDGKENIEIYQTELDKIMNVPDWKKQEFLFCALVFAKWELKNYNEYNKIIKQNIENDIEAIENEEKALLNLDVYTENDLQELKNLNTKKNKIIKRLKEFDERKEKKWFAFNESELFSFAELKCNGTLRNTMIYELIQSGLFDTNTRESKTQKRVYTIPFRADHGEVAMTVTDLDNMVLWLKRYRGDTGISSCTDCGTPIIKTVNSRKYCFQCASKNKKRKIEA